MFSRHVSRLAVLMTTIQFVYHYYTLRAGCSLSWRACLELLSSEASLWLRIGMILAKNLAHTPAIH